jgi:spore coat polysaccharide biosynthesis protein SpsF (cytidylyltransferase family)
VCADSPLLDPDLLTQMLAYSERSGVDLVTNTFPRSFPKGRSLEMLDSVTFARIDPDRLTDKQKEHLTRFYYDNPGSFRILNLESGEPALAATNLSVDTVEDLRRLEAISGEDEAARSIAPTGYCIAK